MKLRTVYVKAETEIEPGWFVLNSEAHKEGFKVLLVDLHPGSGSHAIGFDVTPEEIAEDE